MKYKKAGNQYIIKLEKGEEVIESLTKFCEQNNIKAGSLTGIGATDDATLMYYDREKKVYASKRFNEMSYEIISLNGNISILDNKPLLHVHALLGDADYKTFGGHLGSAKISVTGEIVITVMKAELNRKLDDEFELNLLDL